MVFPSLQLEVTNTVCMGDLSNNALSMASRLLSNRALLRTVNHINLCINKQNYGMSEPQSHTWTVPSSTSPSIGWCLFQGHLENVSKENIEKTSESEGNIYGFNILCICTLRVCLEQTWQAQRQVQVPWDAWGNMGAPECACTEADTESFLTPGQSQKQGHWFAFMPNESDPK